MRARIAEMARLMGEEGSKSSERVLEGRSISIGLSGGGNIGKYACMKM